MEIAPHLVSLFDRRWNLPVIVELRRGRASFGELCGNLAMSRDSLSRTLKALMHPRWVKRTEKNDVGYELTQVGQRLAPPCESMLKMARSKKLETILQYKWPMPIIAGLQGWSLRFNELSAMLNEISPRALALALKELANAGLVQREVVGGYPPVTSYQLTKTGKLFLPFLQEIRDVSPKA